MYRVIKRVTRVEDRKGEDAVLFRDDDGKIAYLDRVETSTDVNIGESVLVWVRGSKERFDFVRVNVGDKTVEEFINSIEDLSLRDMTTMGHVEIDFINDVNNNDILYNNAQSYTDVTLDNLHKMVEYYERHGVNSELSDWIVNSLDLLQFIYNVYSSTNNNTTMVTENETIEEELTRLREEFHANDEFDIDIAMRMHELEKILDGNITKAKKKFKTILKLLDKEKEYVCLYGPRDSTFNIANTSRHNIDKLTISDTDENGWKNFDVVCDEEIKDFLDNIKSISLVEEVWRND